ncbi:NAD-dependent protein deacylase [Desulfosarcina alkanivorans]|uniref:protein acetyllysine N-acetyltransferase n=1 Tax=Desulfosarcina alkanivorans TaxID=571177 RepID=A0A5K7YNC6_9BACT|nr:Sir2 family NAD-dependent protein deacetylase [Desulfosarcina alkanivorans]BBO66087.1 NAD-dependent protein deacylase [Desulfosarcina alkanivorans]
MGIESATHLLTEVIHRHEPVTVLTGAGISAESGIPTFRGPEGFWTIGSREYHPQEMATRAMFNVDPESVWVWYLYRMGLCQKARPNAGHLALAEMESLLGNRFTLITQNVDNLHILAGNSLSRTLQIHGNIFQARCASGCTDSILPLPAGLKPKAKGGRLTENERRRLTCPACGSWVRPHVLWFDETYNERHYRFNSALETAARTRLLITVGTAGATNLPSHIAAIVYKNGGLMIDINVADNPFAGLATGSGQGTFVRRTSSDALVEMARAVALAQSNL